MRGRALAVAALALLCRPASAAETKIVHGATATKIDAVLAAAVPSGFGGAVLVEKNGEIVLKAGYGFADRQAKTPFTVDTIAQIGSITKSMTAIAILQLAEEGKLDLKAQAKAYLPGAAEPPARRRCIFCSPITRGWPTPAATISIRYRRRTCCIAVWRSRSPILPARITIPTWPTASWPPS